MNRLLIPAAIAALALSAPAAAQEAFVGVYVHEVDTPFTLPTNESGADIAAGYRFDRIDALGFIGKPAPYLIASLNTAGDTSFAGAGLSWKLGKGRFYVRPAIGLVVHDGPSYRVDYALGQRTDLGSRVLFEPEIGLGYRVSEKLALEASWMHISQGRIFNAQQNPGIDMIGARLAIGL
ncbi:MAG: acyloxyacyl hydrolase [Croceibacterium sp.]